MLCIGLFPNQIRSHYNYFHWGRLVAFERYVVIARTQRQTDRWTYIQIHRGWVDNPMHHAQQGDTISIIRASKVVYRAYIHNSTVGIEVCGTWRQSPAHYYVEEPYGWEGENMCTTVLHGGVCHRTPTPQKLEIRWRWRRRVSTTCWTFFNYFWLNIQCTSRL